MSDKHLTTGQIAKLVGCAPRTVAKWIDNGMLRGFRLPTATKHAGERRVAAAAFDAFCRAHELMIVGEPEPDPDPPPVAEAALDAAETRRAA